jgi:lambda repressor-like predicted transcriptional regulator
MGRPICTAYVERNREIVSRYVEDRLSLQDLSDEFGLSKVRLRSLLEKQGVELRSEARRTHLQRRARNNILIAMGARLHFDRMKRGLSLAEYAVLINLSEARLSEALRGLHDWRFKELVRTTRVLGISIAEFVAPPAGSAA